MIAPRERLFAPVTSGLRDKVVAALFLSAAAHAGAILWTAGGTSDRTLAVSAGGATVIEVTLVEGSAEGAAGDGGAGSPARKTPAVSPPVAEAVAPTPDKAPAKPPEPPERVVSADSRLPETVLPPAAPDAAPVPPPKPVSPAAATPPGPQFAALPDGRTSPGLRNVNDAPAAAGRGGAPGATGGGTEGAAPRADNPAPRYPFAARRRGQQGRVLLQVEVLPSGEAGRVDIAKSSGVASLDRAAADAVRRWRFHPARQGGVPVRATVAVPVRFALN